MEVKRGGCFEWKGKQVMEGNRSTRCSQNKTAPQLFQETTTIIMSNIHINVNSKETLEIL